MESAPTMPKESTTLLTTVMMRREVMSESATSVMPKLAEYMTLA